MRPGDFSTLGAASENGIEIIVLHMTIKNLLRTETHAEFTIEETDRNHHSQHSEKIQPRSKHTKHTEKYRIIQTAYHQAAYPDQAAIAPASNLSRTRSRGDRPTQRGQLLNDKGETLLTTVNRLTTQQPSDRG